MNQTIRIPHQQLMFIVGVIRHGDKEKAYGKAYPNAKPQSRKPAACRLYNRPEIKQLIDEGRAKAAGKAYEKAMQQGAEIMAEEFLTLQEKRRELARIVRRQQHMTRYYKFKDHVEEKEVIVDNPSAILRAIELDTRLETLSLQQPMESPVELTELPQPPEGHKGIQVYLDKEAQFKGGKNLTDEEWARLLKLSLTDTRIRLISPPLTGLEQKAKCWVERNTETGEYEVLCPEENIGILQKGYEDSPGYYQEDHSTDHYQANHLNQQNLDPDNGQGHSADHNHGNHLNQENRGQNHGPNSYQENHLNQDNRGQNRGLEQLTFINNAPPQTHDTQAIEEKKPMKIICNGVTINK